MYWLILDFCSKIFEMHKLNNEYPKIEFGKVIEMNFVWDLKLGLRSNMNTKKQYT